MNHPLQCRHRGWTNHTQIPTNAAGHLGLPTRVWRRAPLLLRLCHPLPPLWSRRRAWSDLPSSSLFRWVSGECARSLLRRRSASPSADPLSSTAGLGGRPWVDWSGAAPPSAAPGDAVALLALGPATRAQRARRRRLDAGQDRRSVFAEEKSRRMTKARALKYVSSCPVCS